MNMANVILTSDDFGMSNIYNTEMLAAISAGWLSSISVMVERNIARQEKQVSALLELYSKKHLSLGLHLEISSEKKVYAQCVSQWKKFLEITGKTPDYIDIHKDHLFRSTFDFVAAFCKEKNVGFRKYMETNVLVRSPQETLNASYLELDQVLGRLSKLESGEVIEIVFHIGSHDAAITSALNRERENDMAKLESVFNEVTNKGINLVNYKMI